MSFVSTLKVYNGSHYEGRYMMSLFLILSGRIEYLLFTEDPMWFLNEKPEQVKEPAIQMPKQAIVPAVKK